MILKIKYYLGRLFKIKKYMPVQTKLGEVLDIAKLLNYPSDSSLLNKTNIHLDNFKTANQPIVTMSNFGLNGRFGNQLFQYTFLCLVARRQSGYLQLPAWVGSTLFGLNSKQTIQVKTEITNESDMSVSDLLNLIRVRDENFNGIDYNGYAQLHTSHYAADKDFIRSLFIFDTRLVNFFKKALSNTGLAQKKIITIHLRRGDYGYKHYFCAPCTWYENWIINAKYSPDEYIIYICSESPNKYRKRFPKFTVITAEDLRCPDRLAPYFDFMVITLADVVATSNSSFSFFATMLNSKARRFVRPDFEKSGLVDFDPWCAEPVLPYSLSSEQHNHLKLID